MSRSLIACALEARTATILRVKSSGGPSCTVTACRTLGYGLEELLGPKAKKALSKIANAIGEWRDEPVALSISPSSLLTLPAWFPCCASKAERDSIARVEAGHFVREPGEWSWESMPVEHAEGSPDGLEHRLLLFSAAEPARGAARELAQRFPRVTAGLHFEPLARLTAGSDEPMAILELEEEYAVFLVSRRGRADYFRYWPVKHASEREFFAITELESSPLDRVQVTGLAADPATVRRIAAATPRALEPLAIPPQVSTTEARGFRASTGTLRAVAMAMATLADGYK